MTHVIAEPCIGVKDASCVTVCPVDCIHTLEDSEQFYIDPSICIDCTYCVAVCPVSAIFDEFTLPPKWRNYLQVNRKFFSMH